MAPGRAGNPCSDHRAPPRRPLMGEGGRQAQRHRAPHSYRRPVDTGRAPTRSTRRANASTAPQRKRRQGRDAVSGAAGAVARSETAGRRAQRGSCPVRSHPAAPASRCVPPLPSHRWRQAGHPSLTVPRRVGRRPARQTSVAPPCQDGHPWPGCYRLGTGGGTPSRSGS